MLLGWLLWGLLALAVAYVIMMVLPAKEKNGGSIDLYFSSDDGTTPDRKEVQDDAYAVNYEEPGKRILVAFATEYGFSEVRGPSPRSVAKIDHLTDAGEATC